MQRLSLPATRIESRYEVVVVGSGYGGAIAASRLARAGRQVCLLERGKEFVIGGFPDTLDEFADEYQMDAPDGRLGNRTGLYDFRLNPEINVFQGCGLGGTSLVNANVAMEAEPRVFDDARWPSELRGKSDELSHGYELARKMLGSNQYPSHGPRLAKLEAQRKSAEHLGGAFRPVLLNVTFEDRVNASGVHQSQCTLCGDCVSGCNYGSKNTLAMNYLPDARNWGVQIFTQVDVRSVERNHQGWLVHYRSLEAGREAFDASERSVSAEIVILAGGTLGSTEILLRSRARGLPLSSRLGAGFSGNGDLFGFSYDGDQEVNAIGWGERTRRQMSNPDVGPCVASMIDLRHQPALDDGLIIEEGVIPGLFRSVAQACLQGAAELFDRDTDGTPADGVQGWARHTLSLVSQGSYGALPNTQTYLVMSHDDSSGQMLLEDDRLRIRWPRVGEQPIFQRAIDALYKASEALGGSFVKNPSWTKGAGHDLITVDPLGGCCMADSAERGVVDHLGQVFSGTAGRAIHDGLLVCDGAIVPRSLGANPLLTIAALAERNIARLVANRGWSVDYGPRTQPSHAGALAVGVQFTETMKGFIAAGASDYRAGYARGRKEDSPFVFTLTIQSDDVEALLTDPEHRAEMVGTVHAPALSPEPITVTDGQFQLFSADPARAHTKQMRYRMKLTTQQGRRFSFSGYKDIRDDAGSNLWADTTTLYVIIEELGVHDPLRAKGMLHLELLDLVKQARTIHALNASDEAERLRVIARFGAAFLGQLFSTYGKVVAPPRVFDADAPARKRRELRLPAPVVVPLETEDGVMLRLTRYPAGNKGPVLLVPGMGTSTQTFSLDTIDVNLAEYLAAQGYDLWLFDCRASAALPSQAQVFSLDTLARYDYPAAIAKVREKTGAESVQVVAHCVGSASLFLSLLGGYVTHVRSFVASQFTPFVATTPLVELENRLGLPGLMQALAQGVLSSELDGLSPLSAQLHVALSRLYPAQVGQLCNSPACRRIRFMWGDVFLHANLDHATHAAIHELFGEGNLALFEHLARVVRAGKLVAADGADAYLPHWQRLELPISILQGAENALFLPSGSQKFHDELVKKGGSDRYRRRVFAGYGHLDCFIGSRAYQDVFPYVLAELERFARGTSPADARSS